MKRKIRKTAAFLICMGLCSGMLTACANSGTDTQQNEDTASADNAESAESEKQAENLAYVNSLNEDANYTQVIEMFTDFHTPKEGTTVFEPDTDVKDYQWWLARNDGGWQIVTQGF